MSWHFGYCPQTPQNELRVNAMKKLISLAALLLLIPCPGCMTSVAIQEARREPKRMESLATKGNSDGETNAPLTTGGTLMVADIDNSNAFVPRSCRREFPASPA